MTMTDIDKNEVTDTTLVIPRHLMIERGYFYYLGESRFGSETKAHMVKANPHVSVFIKNMTMRRDYMTRCGKVIRCYSSQKKYILTENLPTDRDLCKFCDGSARQWPGHYYDENAWETEAW